MLIGNIRNPPHNVWPAFHYVRVDRTTVLGNPFVIGRDGTRVEVIAKYRTWLPDAYRDDAPKGVRLMIDQLVDHELHSECPTVLLCWCHPQPCHASVIQEFVEAAAGVIVEDYNSEYFADFNEASAATKEAQASGGRT